MKQKNRSEFVLNAPVAGVLLRLTWPMIFGMIGMVIFNLVDTYFVGKLGVTELAAMGFTLPVVMFISAIAVGMGIGASSLISRTIVTEQKRTIQIYTASSLLLAFGVVLIFVIIGQMTIKPLFTMLGANSRQLIFIRHYMEIWYWGILFLIIPMVGNNIIRATGDTLTPGLIMVFSAVINVMLDPVLIFGWGPVPSLKLKGAAIATVISRAMGLLLSIYILMFRDKLLLIMKINMPEILNTWKKVLYVALPASVAMLITPLSIGFITRLISGFGQEAVAAFGVVSRIEMFGLMVLAALSAVLTVFAGQHWGSKKYARLVKGIRWSAAFSILWGFCLFTVLGIWSKSISAWFSTNVHVVNIAADYLRIVSFSYGFQGLLMVTASTLNGINKPIGGVALTFLRMLVLYVPLAWTMSKVWGLTGIFWSAFVANVIVGILAWIIINRILKKAKRNSGIAD